MRKLKEVLRLDSLGLSQHQIARSCSISQSTVHEYVSAAQAAGVRWPLPDNWDEQQLEQALFPQRPVLNSLTSRSSQRSYDHAIREFIDWYCSEPRLAFNKTVVTRYRINLEQAKYASSTINLRLAAIRRLAYEAADCGLLSPDLPAGIRRVKGVKKHGMRIGNWLTADQGMRLLTAFGGEDLRSKRDYAMIAVLLGCGLRRAEVAGLTVEDL